MQYTVDTTTDIAEREMEGDRDSGTDSPRAKYGRYSAYNPFICSAVYPSQEPISTTQVSVVTAVSRAKINKFNGTMM